MSGNLRDTLGNLDLSLETLAAGPSGDDWSPLCFFGCFLNGCHGAWSNASWCGGNGNCDSSQCNVNSNNWHQPPNCYGMSCDTRVLNAQAG